MTQSINLMPKSYRQKLGDHRIRRQYLIYTGFALIAVAALGIQQQILLAARATTENLQLARVAKLHDAQAKCTDLETLINQGIQNLATYQRLALPIELSRVVASISKLFPDEVAVSTMRLWVKESQVARSALERIQGRAKKPKSGNAKQTEIVRVLVCEFTGKAESATQIADLLQNLETHPLFTNIQLDYSKALIINEHDAREFRIVCEVDFQLRYQPLQEENSPENDA